MLLTVAIWLLIVGSLVAIATIVLRKFKILANIDVDSIASEQQAAVKRRILSEKFLRQSKKWYNRLLRLLKPLFRSLGSGLQFIYHKLLEWQKHYTRTDLQPTVDQKGRLENLFVQAQDLLRKEDLSGVENRYIEIIGLDSKNFKAFQLLGELYLQKANYGEAEQTLQHAIKLRETAQLNLTKDLELANIYYDLSDIAAEQSDNQQAISYLKQALAIEPQNPRYLDKMIELCLLIKNKGDAYDYCKRLTAVNSDNQKLTEFRQKIIEL